MNGQALLQIINSMAIKGLSKEEDIPQLFDYLMIYPDEIEKYKGWFNIKDNVVDKFLNHNDIFYGSYKKDNILKAKKHQWYLLFEQNKNSKKSGSDVAHHLLRHIRNAIAHANIEKIIKKEKKVNHQILSLKDYSINGNSQTMDGRIESKLFYQLIDLILQTKKDPNG
ncbi:MAG: hypothetical protein J1E97_00715 [Muribaculaceae bacterium]|nr:hypothetical protein [Muribaculaceae bacterium]